MYKECRKSMTHLLKALPKLVIVAISLMLICINANANNPEDEFLHAMEKNKGKVVYLDFWASWCVPCRKSFPWMNIMQEKYQQQGFVVLSINLDAQVTFAEQFLQQNPANFDVIYDAKGVLAKKFQLKGMPSSYLFDRHGNIISAHSGFNGKKQQKYQQEIEQALATKS